MKKKTAKTYDRLLSTMAEKPRFAYHPNHLKETLGEDAMLWQNFTQTALADGFIEPIRHPGAPMHDFGIYSITPQGVNFILHQGGYARKRRFQNYADTNMRFTWMRHWIWFYSAILSLLVNLYFIATYL